MPKAKAQPRAPQAVSASGSHVVMPLGVPLTKKRGRMPDLDEAVSATDALVEQAKKEMKKASNVRRNAQRRRTRMVKKAAQCPREDLYKIAVYKKTNFLAYIMQQDKPGLKTTLERLVKDTDKGSVMELIGMLCGMVGVRPPTGTASGSGASDVADAGSVIMEEEEAVPQPTAAARLPELPPLEPPLELPEGGEYYPEGQSTQPVPADAQEKEPPEQEEQE